MRRMFLAPYTDLVWLAQVLSANGLLNLLPLLLSRLFNLTPMPHRGVPVLICHASWAMKNDLPTLGAPTNKYVPV